MITDRLPSAEEKRPSKWLPCAAALIATLIPALASGEDRFGRYRDVLDELPGVCDLATIGEPPLLFATCRESHVIAIFSIDGEKIQKLDDWGTRGSAPGEFLRPSGIAAAPDDSAVYIVDSGNHRIQRLGIDGLFQVEWGELGSGPQQLRDPRGIAVTEDHVYVADSGNHRIQVFTRDGEHVRGIGLHGFAPGSFRRPLDVAVDSAGNIYVADTDNHRVQKLSKSGEPSDRWGGWGAHPGLFQTPSSVTVLGELVFVADTRMHRIQAFSRDGKHEYQWGAHVIRPHEGRGLLHYPAAVAASRDGTAFFVAEPFEDRCQVFSRSDVVYGENPDVFGVTTESHYGPRCATAGRWLTVTEPDTCSVLLFDLTTKVPVLVTRFGGHGRALTNLLRSTGVFIESAGPTVHVSDAGYGRLQSYRVDAPDDPVFTPFITDLVTSVDLTGIEGAEPTIIGPRAVRRDPGGNTILIDARERIVVLDPEYRWVRDWGRLGTGPGEFRRATDLTVGADGEIFVVDADNLRIQVFSASGEFLRAFGGPAPEGGGLSSPFGITGGRDGFVYVTDVARHRVEKFEVAGRHVASWGGAGIGAGELFKPRGIAQAEDGRIIVIDHGNHRGQIFSSEGEYIEVFGSLWFTDPARRGRR